MSLFPPPIISVKEHVELTLVKSGSPSLTSGMEGKVRSGFIMSVPFLRVKRFDMTTKRSEVFFTGRNRRRGTLIPGKCLCHTASDKLDHSISSPFPPTPSHIPTMHTSPFFPLLYPRGDIITNPHSKSTVWVLWHMVQIHVRQLINKFRLDSKSCQHHEQAARL